MYWVLAAAAAGITPTTGIRVGHLIGRNRHRVDAADQFSGLGLLIGGEESVLRRLGSLELQTLVFSRQSSNLVLSQKVWLSMMSRVLFLMVFRVSQAWVAMS